MLLGLTEDQAFFRETTERFLAEQVPPDALRSLRDDPAGFDPAVLAARCGARLDLVAGGRGARRRDDRWRRVGRPQPRRLRVRSPCRTGAVGGDQRGRGHPQRLRRRPRRVGRPVVRRGDRVVVRPRLGTRRVAADAGGPPSGVGRRGARRGPPGGVGPTGRLLPRHLSRRGRRHPGARSGGHAGRHPYRHADGRSDPSLRHRRDSTMPPSRSVPSSAASGRRQRTSIASSNCPW